jgi:hypothetical protein
MNSTIHRRKTVTQSSTISENNKEHRIHNRENSVHLNRSLPVFLVLKSHHGLNDEELFCVSFSLLNILFSSPLRPSFLLSSCPLLMKEKEKKGGGRTWNVIIGHIIKAVLYS